MLLRLLTHAAALPAALVLIAIVVAGRQGHAAEPTISGDTVKIGIMNDQSGLYADLAGPGSVVAAKMAIDEFGGTVLGKKIELVVADHQNKADIGAAKAREWFDRDGVDMVADFSNSSVGFAVQSLAKDRNKVAIIMAASSDFTGKACTATSAQWVYTSYSNGYSLAKTMTEAGDKSWFLLTVDYAFGHAFANDIRKAVTESGGTVEGEVRHPPQYGRFQLISASGPILPGKGGGPRQRRCRYGERNEAGCGIRHQQDQDVRRADRVHHRRPRDGPRQRAGPSLHCSLLLGSQ